MFRTKFYGNGAGDRIRTGDINLGKVALYQLSYSREANVIHCRAQDGALSNSAEAYHTCIQEYRWGLQVPSTSGFTECSQLRQAAITTILS
jgi:hypothetical protein